MSTTTPKQPAGKASMKSKVVVLRLPRDALSAFPSDMPSTKPTPSPINDVAPAASDSTPSINPPYPTDKASDANTPAPTADNDEPADPNALAPPAAGNKRKRGGGAASGRKRAPPSIDPNAPPKERGRPGPKKKPRLPDGTIDRSQDPLKKPTTTNGATPAANGTANGAPAPIPAHKLGPKANTGAINAGLRALDRSGKPCRKWARKGLALKSFTGCGWTMPSWRTPQRGEGFAGDVKSDSQGSSEVKPEGEGMERSSAVGSERSRSGEGAIGSGVGGGDVEMGGMENGSVSSPAPAPAVEA